MDFVVKMPPAKVRISQNPHRHRRVPNSVKKNDVTHSLNEHVSRILLTPYFFEKKIMIFKMCHAQIWMNICLICSAKSDVTHTFRDVHSNVSRSILNEHLLNLQCKIGCHAYFSGVHSNVSRSVFENRRMVKIEMLQKSTHKKRTFLTPHFSWKC